MRHLRVESSFLRYRGRWDLARSSRLAACLPASASRTVVETGHFTAPYPQPTAYFPTPTTLETIEVGVALADRLHRVGSMVEHATMVGDLAFPPKERRNLFRIELPLDITRSHLVLESRARNKGKKRFDQLRHKLLSREDVVRFFDGTGGLLLSGPVAGGIGFTATPAAARFPQPPFLSLVATANGQVPLCSLIIAGKLLVFLDRRPDLIVTVYNRADDINIREKNFWGGCLFCFLGASLGHATRIPRLVNLTLTGSGGAWLDSLELITGPSPVVAKVDELVEYLAFSAGVDVEPYLLGALERNVE